MKYIYYPFYFVIFGIVGIVMIIMFSVIAITEAILKLIYRAKEKLKKGINKCLRVKKS